MSQFWGGKTAIVTGGCGFVGQHLVRLLLNAGATVKVFTRHYKWWTQVDGVEYYTGRGWDMRNLDVCRKAFGGQPDAVFNLAAVVGGQQNTLNNQATHFFENVRLQCAPAIAAFAEGIPLFLQVSSVSAYSTVASTHATEEVAYEGMPVYGYAIAKRMGENTVRWLWGRDGIETPDGNKAVIVRCTNMYGEYDNFGPGAHVVPILIRRFAESDGSPIILYGDGRGTRDLLHAEDGARGMIAALEHGTNGRIYNLGTSGREQISIRVLAEKIKALMGSQSEIVFEDYTAVADSHRCIMADRAREELGWSHRIPVDEGLERTIKWFMESDIRRGIDVE
jgi:nucleoside-diphosphate-sugar epimerase